MDIALSGPFQRLDVQSFKITLKIALQASHTVRQAITALLLDRYTGVQIDRALIPSVSTGTLPGISPSTSYIRKTGVFRASEDSLTKLTEP